VHVATTTTRGVATIRPVYALLGDGNTRAEIEQTLAELRTGRFIREEPQDG